MALKQRGKIKERIVNRVVNIGARPGENVTS